MIIKSHRVPGFNFVARGEWSEEAQLTLVTARVNGKLVAGHMSDNPTRAAQQMLDL
jgi:hypothetical protein